MSIESKHTKHNNFIRSLIMAEKETTGDTFRLHTRFPPEPNGYLHLGHSKSIFLNSGLAQEFNGKFNLRFDDTNPLKESSEYVQAIIEDINWLGIKCDHENIFYASDYFDSFYQWALELVKTGKAYVDEQDSETVRLTRGTPTKVGQNSPYRDRSIVENLDLLEKMRQGKIGEGKAILRAKIDMSHPNIYMRDPALYRIRHIEHHRLGSKWCIYPMYDFAHGYEDAIEGITHSICTLEFKNHRPLYNWLLENVELPHRPRQIEFAPLNLTYTVLSKRYLRELVETKVVDGWDDPRMPTIRGMRRRGYTPSSLRRLSEEIGVGKVDSIVDIEFLNYILREELNHTAPRVMVVLDPIKLVITNYPEEKQEIFEAENHPDFPEHGTRSLPFSRELYIDRSDFMLDAPKKYFRLSIGREVRLKYTYYVTADSVVTDSDGNITEVHCHYDPESRGGGTPDGRKVKGTIQWVDAKQGVPCEVNDFNHLFTESNLKQIPENKSYNDYLNPLSKIHWQNAIAEPEIHSLRAQERLQFMRLGYYFHDSQTNHSNKLIFNRIVSLKDSWKKINEQKG